MSTSRDEKLGAALRALETPEHRPGFDDELRRRLDERPRRSRPRILAIAAALTAAVVVPALVLTLGSDDAPRDWSAAVGDLPALAPGEPSSQGAGTGSTSIIMRVTREDLIANSTRVFVGTVVAEGGSELVDPEGQDFPRMTVHRVRFSVERTLRGEETDALDVTIPDGDPTIDVFEVGDRLLVFARPTEFGELRVPGLVPEGYFQGVFPVRADGTAGTGDETFSLDELEAELAG
jgi:hypothetical protein